MDPATIIGTASAILSFVQFSAKVISTAIEIRDNAGQATKSNQELGLTVEEFKCRLAALRSEVPALRRKLSGLSVAHDDALITLLRCSAKCEDLGTKIEVLIVKIEGPGKDHTKKFAEKLKFWRSSSSTPSKGPSNVHANASSSQALITSLKSVWSEKEMKSLREQWEQCVTEFNASFMRLDTQIRLEALQQVSDSNSTTLNALQRDLQTMVVHYKDANLKALGSFLDDYNTQNSMASKERRNCEYILKLLEFPGIDARREQVRDAATGTFGWLLNQDSVPRGHDELEISLKKWLATGTGVYHITGKPGSGKSTLMKLVGESSESTNYLREWATRDQKQLITANFFTWKAADSNRLQNKVEGMLRSLLHQILTHERCLMSRVFPDYWHPEMFHANSAITGTKLLWKEIQKASERIFESSDVIREYRIFLIIDGMDEFDDGDEAHYQVAERVMRWCRHNPNNVKACVSSREDSPFMNAFPAQQRLHLHLITSEDIRRLTEQRLKKHPHFGSSSFTDKQRVDLIKYITHKAQGVFLWVVLTLVELTHLLDAREDFEALHELVMNSSKTLQDLIKEIVSRIPRAYVRDAQRLFQIVQYTTRYSMFMDLFHVHQAVTYARPTNFLTECVKHTISYDEAVKEIATFKDRFPALSKGLLELRGLEDDEAGYLEMRGPDAFNDMCSVAGPDAWFRVSFMHRSVFDFFEENTKGLWNEEVTENAPGAFALIILSSAHLASALTWQQPDACGRARHHGVRFWRIFVGNFLKKLDRCKADSIKSETQFFALKALDAALLHKQRILPEDISLDSSQWSDVSLPPRSLHGTASVFLTACIQSREKQSVCSQFVSWAVNGGYPDWVRHSAFKTRVAQHCFAFDLDTNHWRFPWPNDIHPEFLGINDFVDANLLPESIPFSTSPRGSIWLTYLVYTIKLVASYQLGSGPNIDNIPETSGFAIPSMLSSFLELGVQPYIFFHWWAKGFGTQRSDRHQLHDEAGNGASVISLTRSSLTEAFHSPDDSARTEGTTIGSLPQGSEAANSTPLDFEFGLEIIVGTDPARQVSQEPQKTSIQDIMLMRFFVFHFRRATGTASQVDVLRVISSILRDPGMRPRWGRLAPKDVGIKQLDLAITALSQTMAQDTCSDISDGSADGKHDHASDMFESHIGRRAQELPGTEPGQAKQLILLVFKGLLREYRAPILAVIGKHTSPVNPQYRNHTAFVLTR